MASRIYLKTASGNPLYTAGGNRLYLRDLPDRALDLPQALTIRAARRIDLYGPLYTIIRRALDLVQPLSVFTRAGYLLYAYEMTTGAETYLGFVPSSGPLQLDAVALADGRYWIEVRLSGYCWQEHRILQRFPICISGGVPVEPLPAATDLSYRWDATATYVSWSWTSAPGDGTPIDWAIWTGAADPVDVSGVPAYAVASAGPGRYSKAVAQGAAALYVAIRARNGLDAGPVATLAIPAPPADLASPDNQAAIKA